MLGLLAGVLSSPELLRAQTGGTGLDPSLVLYFDFEQANPDWHVVDKSGHGSDGWQFNQTNLTGVTTGVFGTAAAQFTYAGYISNDLPSIYH
ncbi:MAG TPA: hypothetical protein VL793_15435, partial [Patescibacteria group bacterium]|nr:hypothetical protein [Patescibacteria group bacterium]